ncbi:raffinose/stachyose/melibiose transport system permease protein [Kibdelosporangium banguiense]|uniref:Raffinose/stachyose/melibiose transport system permease protein n=1 Tax=Kibdelosporangium banguiense TaxID=1365924 RepID=A0ABS4TNP4_9PSEU|nr:sugar ABC transporter permease [Kibdelosporangium banguiense]MBP2326026.1 raffinose/stachyose/melibiose transport system permease protein [Kibdelosporangium banguiense]
MTAIPSARRRAAAQPWWFALPAIAVFAVFFLLPNLLNFVYPFTDWSAFKSGIGFVGLANFETIWQDGSLMRAIRVTVLYAVGVAIFQNAFGLGLALLLERDTRFNRFFRALFFLPVLISALAVGYLFQALLAQDGAVNKILSDLTGSHVDVPWLGSPTWTLLVVTLVHGWKWMGLAMLVYLAGLKSVPGEMLEAAKVDGASRWRTFWSIRLPMLAPAVTFNVTTALIGSMNTFDIVQATTKGGPAAQTEVFNIYMFRIFGQGLYAQASAMSLVLFGIVVLLAIPVVIGLRRREHVL